MNIKKVSELTGLSADTIRYYEKIGLLPPVRRTASGIRDFREQDISILNFVKCFRKVGMTVENLADYMALVQEGDKTIGARLALLLAEKERLELQLEELQSALERLNYKIDNYETSIGQLEKSLFDD